MTPEEYRQAQADLSTRAEQTALAVTAATPFGFTLALQLGTFLATVNQTATLLADAFTANALRLPPLGLRLPEGETDRLTAVLAGVLEDNRADPLPRVARIAKNEPAVAAREATRSATELHSVGARLRWVLDPDPCPLCISLAGKTYAVDELPQSHPNCECTTVPTYKKEKAA